MARSLFSGSPGDFIALPPSTTAGVVKVSANLSATGTAWTAATGGTQITDLLSAAGASIGGLSTDPDGYLVPFQGPDGVERLWVDFGSSRRLMESQTYALDISQKVAKVTGMRDTKVVYATTAWPSPVRVTGDASIAVIFAAPAAVADPVAVAAGSNAGMQPGDLRLIIGG